MTTIIAKKDLIHDDKSKSFTKGKEYQTGSYSITSQTMTCNDQGPFGEVFRS